MPSRTYLAAPYAEKNQAKAQADNAGTLGPQELSMDPIDEDPNQPRKEDNHGARRFRGSKWAEKATIPGFIDNYCNDDDQVIENLQRNEMTAR